jgi:hypothetical protein
LQVIVESTGCDLSLKSENEGEKEIMLDSKDVKFSFKLKKVINEICL